MPDSSVAEQVTVNHLVVGSTPTRAATLAPRTTSKSLGLFCAPGFSHLATSWPVLHFSLCPRFYRFNAAASGRRGNKVQRRPTRTLNGIARPRRLAPEREPGHAANPSASLCSARSPLFDSRLRPEPHAAHVTPAKLSCRLLAPPGWSASGLPSLRWRSGQTPPSAVVYPAGARPTRHEWRVEAGSCMTRLSRPVPRPLRSRFTSRARP